MASIEEQLLSESRKTNDLLNRLIRGGGGSLSSGLSSSPSSSSGGGGSSGGGIVEGALNNIGALSRGFVRLTEGSLTAGTAVDTFGRAISGLGPAGKALGQLTTDLGAVILKTNDNMNEAGKTGANWNNNIGEYNRAITGARMTQDEYNRMMKDGASSLSGLGSTVNRSQANFLEFDKQFQESGVINQLKKMGLSAEEVSQVAMATMVNRKGLDLSTAKAQKEAAEAAINLTAAMEETTRITGISRQAQVDDLAARTKDAKVMASLMEMPEEMFNQYLAMQQNFKSLGPVVQDLADEIMTGGIRTKEGSEKMAALGPAGAELEKAVRLQMSASTAAQKADAELAMQRAHAAINEQMHSKSFLDTARIATGGFADATRSALTGNAELGSRLAKVKEMKNETGKTVGMEEAGKGQTAEVQRNMAGKNAEGHTFGEGSTTGQSVNEINRAFKDATAIAAGGLTELSVAAGKAIKALDKFPEIVKPRKQEDGSQIVDDLKKKVHLSLPEAYNTATNLKTTPAQMAAPVQVEKRATGSPSLENVLNGSGGFKDMFEHFDPKGVPAELHGTELVATEDQMKRLINKIIPADMFDKIKSQTPNVPPVSKPEMSDVKSTTPVTAPKLELAPDVTKDADTARIKPTSTAPQSAEDVIKAFSSVTTALQAVVNQLLEVTTKLKTINPEAVSSKVNEQVTKTFEKVNPQEIVKSVSNNINAAKPAEVKSETKPEEHAKMTQDEVHKIVAGTIKTSENAQQAKPVEKPVEKPLAPIEAAFKLSFEKMNALVEKMNPGMKSITDVKPIEPPTSLIPKELPKLNEPKELTKAEANELTTGIKSAETIQRNLRESTESFFKNKIDELKGRKDEDAVHDLPIVEAQYAQFKPKAAAEAEAEKRQREETLARERKEKESEKPAVAPVKEEKPKAPDLSKLDASLLNLAKFKQAVNSGDISKMGMSQMDLSETGIAAEKKLGPSTASIALQKKREALENAAFDYEQMKAANTKPSAESAERLAKKKDELSKIAVEYEEDLIRTKGKLKFHAERENNNAEIKNKQAQDAHALQVKQALAQEQKFMKEHGPESAKKPTPPEVPIKPTEPVVFSGTATQAKTSNIFEDLGSSIAGIFKSSNKPAFASGNVKYENVPQLSEEEQKAKTKKLMESPLNPDEIALLEAERARQSDSSRYKQKTETAAASVTKEQSQNIAKPKFEPPKHIGGLETFKEYNARMDAQVAEQRSQIKNVMTQPIPTLTANDLTPPKPQAKPQAVVEQPQQIEQVAPAVAAKEITLKDIHDVLMQLNKNMAEMVQHTDSIKDNSRKQISATKSISNNRF